MSWEAFGDKHPKKYSGRFGKETDYGFTFIETMNLGEAEWPEGQWAFNHYYIDKADVYADRDPDNGFTGRMQQALDSVKCGTYTPDTPAYQKQPLKYVSLLCGAIPSVETTYTDEYWDELERYGIKREKVQR